MRIHLGLVLGFFGVLGPFYGTLPEFKDKFGKKTQPLESYSQQMKMQEEVPEADPNRESNPSTVAAELKLPERETAIASKYLGLSNSTDGTFYTAIERPLISVLGTLLREHLVAGADVVFLIDHTSSMEDDIHEIVQEINQLIQQFAEKGDVRAGIVTFSDVKSGSKFGYCAHGLTDNYEGLGKFLSKIELLGSIEDIYGAIWKTIDEFTWKSKTKRMIVLISDDKPATGKDTNHSEEDVILQCAKAGVHTNLYPVLVDKYSPLK